MNKLFAKLVVLGLVLMTLFSAVICAESDTGTWRQAFQASVPNFNQFTYGGFFNAQLGIYLGHYGEIRYTADGGKTWKRSKSDTTCRYCLDFVNDKVVWNCGDMDITAGKSDDAGATWQYPASANIGGKLPDHSRFISFCDENTGWVADLKKVKKTSDAGSKWLDLKLPDGCADMTAIFLRTVQDGYVLDMEGHLFMTHDGGESWSQKTIGEAFRSRKQSPYVALNFSDDQHGFIVICFGGETRSLTTSDGGATWIKETISADISGFPYISRNGQFLTVCSNTEAKMTLFQRR